MTKRLYGVGSVHKVHKLNPDGSVGEFRYWQAVDSLMVVCPETGKKKRKKITGSGATAALATERRRVNREMWELQNGNGSRSPRVAVSAFKGRRPASPTFEVAFREWLISLGSEAVTDTVKHKYKRTIELHILPVFGQTAISEITHTMLEQHFHEDLSRMVLKTKPDGTQVMEQRLGPSVRKQLKTVTSLIFDNAIRSGYVTNNPTKTIRVGVSRPKHPNVNATAVQAKRLFALMQKHNQEVYCQYLFQLLGLRQSERLGLTWADITNLDKPQHARIRVRHQLERAIDGSGYRVTERTKSAKSTRIIPLTGEFLRALREHKKRQALWRTSEEWDPLGNLPNLVFTTKTGRPVVHKADTAGWKKVLKEHNIEYWRGHLNRHLMASIFANSKEQVPTTVVRDLLGHSSNAMTYYYTHTDEKATREAMLIYNSLVKNGGGGVRATERNALPAPAVKE